MEENGLHVHKTVLLHTRSTYTKSKQTRSRRSDSSNSIIILIYNTSPLSIRFFICEIFFVPLKFSLMFYSCKSLLILMVFREREGENTYTHMYNIQELYTQIIRIVLVNPVIVLALNMCKCETRCWSKWVKNSSSPHTIEWGEVGWCGVGYLYGNNVCLP